MNELPVNLENIAINTWLIIPAFSAFRESSLRPPRLGLAHFRLGLR